MLDIKNIKKEYLLGNQTFTALKGINVSFRKSEFVAILGQSGSGKTTLLNIIGGLDRYNSGDLVIDGTSTKEYKDKDWDAYRNHRIGFVFQNYNLIPHLSVLDNVELAQTLTGVSKSERTKRALEVLTRVGLLEHVNKRPNQLSGGQQQRVSIARALVNDPSIILADEPTGALDSETSVDIMNLIREISNDKLIIMVTHNAELAKKYANRTVELKDGEVISDTNPYKIPKEVKKENTDEKTSMSFFTALRLSFKNLLTKKVRTLITALAGSIGIIGVALVMSLQYGFTNYLDNMERGTFAGLPINVNRTYTDLSAIMTPGQPGSNGELVENGVGGYEPPQIVMSKTNTNIAEYITYIESSDLLDYSTVVYGYGFAGQFYYKDGNILNYNPKADGIMQGQGRSYISQSSYSNEFLNEYFDLVSGKLYDNTNMQALLVVNSSNRVPNAILEYLGFLVDENTVVTFDQIIGKTFKTYTNDAYYIFDNGTYRAKTEQELLQTYDSNASSVVTIEIVGVVKTNSDFITASESIIYSNAVSKKILELNDQSNIVIDQRLSDINVIGNKPFTPNLSKEDQLYVLGGIDTPTEIMIYPNSFDSKAEIIAILDQFNVGKDDDDKVIYSDNVATALSMIKTVMNAISAVLIAFSAISLFVSSVMIGIITYTSVLERTKEIGILRSIGARKKDISRVFNAESILIGLSAGVLGVIITYGLTPIVNIILKTATNSDNIAQLYYGHAILLIAISVGLTFVAGLLPSRIAAKKDPVVALRSE